MTIEIINNGRHPLPSYQTIGSAGMDIYASLESVLTLHPMQRELVPTGLFMALPEGYEAQIRPRSGLAISRGLTCLNTPGTIDSDYRGEIRVIIINLSKEIQHIQDGDRIAQMVISRYEKVAWKQVDNLITSERGEGGFGSTG